MANLPKCPHCGSKNVSRVDNFYRCADCLSDYGRTPYDDKGVPMIESCTGIRVRLGDFLDGSIRIRLCEDGDVCLYEIYDSNGGGLDKYADVLSAAEWKKFRKELFEKIYVNDWDKIYIAPNDGRAAVKDEEWELSVIVDEDEEYIYRGYGEYPVYWDRFIRLIKPLLNNLNK